MNGRNDKELYKKKYLINSNYKNCSNILLISKLIKTVYEFKNSIFSNHCTLFQQYL